VVKWGVSVNLALAVAAATPALVKIQFYLLLLSCGVAWASWLLVRHYNKRMTIAKSCSYSPAYWRSRRSLSS
jgi:hypothetical protein